MSYRNGWWIWFFRSKMFRGIREYWSKRYLLYFKEPPFLFSETYFKIFVNKSHTYYDQIQMQLAVTTQSWCHFIFCTSFLVFSGSIIKDQWEKWINKISSLHLKVPQKVPGSLLNFYTELALELDQDLLFLRTSTVLLSRLELKS